MDLSYNYFNVISIIQNDVIFGSNLRYLDLYYNYNISMDNLDWLSQLSSLRYLNLGYTYLRNANKWLQLFSMLPSLSDLRLSYCRLTNISPFLKNGSLTSIVTLDLSLNNFNSELPHWLFNLS
ncbi:hypothetical protein V8G54_020457, partial [Vigna mungo]